MLERLPGDFPTRCHRLVQRGWVESHLREPPLATDTKSWTSTCSCRGPGRSGRVESLAGRWFASLLSCWYPLQLLVLIGSGQRRCAGYRIDGIPWEQGFGLRTRSALRPAERGRSPSNGACASKSGMEAASGRGALPAVALEKVYLCEELGNSQHSQFDGHIFNQSPICGSARRMWVLLRTSVTASGGMGGIHPTSCTALVLGCSWSA